MWRARGGGQRGRGSGRSCLLAATTKEPQRQPQRSFAVNFAPRQRVVTNKHRASVIEALEVRWNAFAELNQTFNILDSVQGSNVQRDSFAREVLDKDLHVGTCARHRVLRSLRRARPLTRER